MPIMTSKENIPSFDIPCRQIVGTEGTEGNRRNLGLATTRGVRADTVQVRLPSLAARRYKHCSEHSNQLAYGTPEIVKQIYTGQLPADFFDNVCMGRRDMTPREFSYNGPETAREAGFELWQPKQYDRIYWSANRHLVREVQDARFRHKHNLEMIMGKGIRRRKMSENVRLRDSEQMSRGLVAYLTNLDKQTQHLKPLIKKKVAAPRHWN